MMSCVIEFLSNRIYFMWIMPGGATPVEDAQVHYFSIDHEFIYVPFNADFGPLNLANVMLFQRLMAGKLGHIRNKKICLYTQFDDRKRANAAFLLCCFMMLYYGQTPEQACKPLDQLPVQLTPFRDAGQGPTLFDLRIIDCLRGLRKALDCKLLNLDTLDVTEYLFREKIENGDMNWIVPGKFLAMAGPEDEIYERQAALAEMQGRVPFRFKDLTHYLQRCNVSCVVRLNNKLYDRRRFLEAGIDHLDLYFADGSNPPEPILQRFLTLAETHPGPIAIHCKAGLGRTGTLIAAYLMKHYRFTAAEVIGYLRVMRPGSVVGPQQLFLQSIEERLWQAGAAYELQQLQQQQQQQQQQAMIPKAVAVLASTGIAAQQALVDVAGSGAGIATTAYPQQATSVPVQPNKRNIYLSMMHVFKSDAQQQVQTPVQQRAAHSKGLTNESIPITEDPSQNAVDQTPSTTGRYLLRSKASTSQPNVAALAASAAAEKPRAVADTTNQQPSVVPLAAATEIKVSTGSSR